MSLSTRTDIILSYFTLKLKKSHLMRIQVFYFGILPHCHSWQGLPLIRSYFHSTPFNSIPSIMIAGAGLSPLFSRGQLAASIHCFFILERFCLGRDSSFNQILLFICFSWQWTTFPSHLQTVLVWRDFLDTEPDDNY